jgi:hypothetical protein
VTVSWALKLCRHELSDSDCLYFARTYFSVPLEDVSFNKRHQQDGASPHYSREVRQLFETYPGRWNGRVRECPYSWPTRSPDLNPFDTFCVYSWKQNFKFMPLQSILERNCVVGFNNFKLNNKYTRDLRALASFFFHAELSCVSVNMEEISSTSCGIVKINRLLIALLFSSYTQPVTLREYLRCDDGIWKSSFNILTKAVRVHNRIVTYEGLA